jgi:hypothetical protein
VDRCNPGVIYRHFVHQPFQLDRSTTFGVNVLID